MNKRKISELNNQDSIYNINFLPRDLLKYILSFARFALVRFVSKRWRELDLEIKRENRERNKNLSRINTCNEINYQFYCEHYCRCIHITVYDNVDIFNWYRQFDSFWSRNWDKKYWIDPTSPEYKKFNYWEENQDKLIWDEFEKKEEEEQEAHEEFQKVCLYGEVEVMDYILNNKIGGICFISEECLSGCTESGDLEKLEWVYSKSSEHHNYNRGYQCFETYESAVIFGDVEFLEYLLENNRDSKDNQEEYLDEMFLRHGILYSVIYHDRLDLLTMIYQKYGGELLLSYDDEDGDPLLHTAVKNQSMACVEFLLETVKVTNFDNAMESAARNDIAYVKLLVDHKVPIEEGDVMEAAVFGKLKILKYFKELGITIDKDKLRQKIEHCKTLNYLKERIPKYNKILEWLNQN